MAVDYLARSQNDRTVACRFDVVAIDGNVGAAPRVTIIPGAFD